MQPMAILCPVVHGGLLYYKGILLESVFVSWSKEGSSCYREVYDKVHVSPCICCIHVEKVSRISVRRGSNVIWSTKATTNKQTHQNIMLNALAYSKLCRHNVPNPSHPETYSGICLVTFHSCISYIIHLQASSRILINH